MGEDEGWEASHPSPILLRKQMIRELMGELRGASEPLSRDDLAERLNADVNLVEDMLDTLVRMGKLERIVEVIGEGSGCAHCSGNCGNGRSCDRLAQIMPRSIRYRVAMASGALNNGKGAGHSACPS